MEVEELIKITQREYFSALFANGGNAAKDKLFKYMDIATGIKFYSASLSDDYDYLYDDFESFVSEAHTQIMFVLLESGSAATKSVIKEWLAIASNFNSRGK